MGLHLSSDDLTRLGAAQTALLSPLAAHDAEAWGRQVARSLCALLRADSAFVLLPTEDRRVVTHDLDLRVLDVLDHFIKEPARTGAPPPDPSPRQAERSRRARGTGVMTYPIIDSFIEGSVDDAPFANEMRSVVGTGPLHGMYLPVGLAPGTRAQIDVYHRRDGASPFGDAGHEIMALLIPAFQAGAASLSRYDGQRAALDALAEPVVVFGADGRTLHRNAAFERAVAADTNRLQVVAAAQVLAHDLATIEGACHPERTVATARGTYLLRGTSLSQGGPFGDEPCVLVSVEAPAAPWPEAPALRERFGLTRREAEVALLLARGLANDAVAFELCISPHTARRHTERVMAKLSVSARSQVAAAILARTA